MPRRIRLGPVSDGVLQSTEATLEIDNGDLYITVDAGDIRTDGTVAFEDATADPSANGELQRNGADLKAYSGGAVRNFTSPTFDAVKTDKSTESEDSGNISGATDLDLDVAMNFVYTLTGDVTFSIVNPETGAYPVNYFSLLIDQDGTGGHAITWPGSVEWDSGTAPSLSTGANDKHMLSFVSYDGGTTWIGIEGPQGIA